MQQLHERGDERERKRAETREREGEREQREGERERESTERESGDRCDLTGVFPPLRVLSTATRRLRLLEPLPLDLLIQRLPLSRLFESPHATLSPNARFQRSLGVSPLRRLFNLRFQRSPEPPLQSPLQTALLSRLVQSPLQTALVEPSLQPASSAFLVDHRRRRLQRRARSILRADPAALVVSLSSFSSAGRARILPCSAPRLQVLSLPSPAPRGLLLRRRGLYRTKNGARTRPWSADNEAVLRPAPRQGRLHRQPGTRPLPPLAHTTRSVRSAP